MREVVWIEDGELLLRGIPFKDKPPAKYVDDGALTSLVFKDRHNCPSVHMATYADLATLIEEVPDRFAFAVIVAGDVRARSLGEVIHNPDGDHYSHALIIPLPDMKQKPKNWLRALRDLVWDLIFIPERVERFRSDYAVGNG